MSDTLGALVDKLSIVELKLAHCDSDLKMQSLTVQKARLLDEIDTFVGMALLDPDSVVLVNPANKIYKGAETAQQHSDNLGGLIAELIQANIEMWHCQEVTYERETLEAFSKQQMLDYLTRAAKLNIERNEAIDRLDACFAERVKS